MTPEQIRFMEWAKNQPGNLSIKLFEKCECCFKEQPILRPLGLRLWMCISIHLWCCGKCWYKYVEHNEPIEE